MTQKYDAILVVSFGGPEKREDVMPFLENVLRGKNVPRDRMLEVAEHYYLFDGVSPINRQNRDLIAALRQELDNNQCGLPIYWGNRNWDPLLPNTIRQMADDGIDRAIGFFTSAFGSYSSCRQYREDIQRARQEIGSKAPVVDKLRAFFNHPDFLHAAAERVREALQQVAPERRESTPILFTAHSIPIAMASTSPYLSQLQETTRLVGNIIGHNNWHLVYQSRSGPPSQPWLEPDICDWLNERAKATQLCDVIVMPIGFISDHMEVIYDLDIEVRQCCERLNINLVRAATVGTHPQFITMIYKLIEERLSATPIRSSMGTLGPGHDICPATCCPAPMRPVRRGR